MNAEEQMGTLVWNMQVMSATLHMSVTPALTDAEDIH